jgi:hypothetical protein
MGASQSEPVTITPDLVPHDLEQPESETESDDEPFDEINLIDWVLYFI